MNGSGVLVSILAFIGLDLLEDYAIAPIPGQ